jgi:hypothetical protein
MKKLILSGTALLLSLCFAKAQGWETTGMHDTFDSVGFYKNGPNLEGVVWFSGDPSLTLGRLGDGKMTVAAVSAGGAGNYPLFGVNCNDANDNGTGTPFTMDLSSYADIKIDVKNVSSQLLFMDIKLVDINDVQSEFEPNVDDVVSTLTWADPNRKALNGFTLAANQRKTITIDLSSKAGKVGGLSGSDLGGPAGYYDCTGPSDCPQTAYLIDITKIKAILFRVNFGNNNIDLSEGDGVPTTETFISGGSIVPYTGTIEVYDFKIGTTTLATTNAAIDRSLMVYPNPAKEQLNISFDAAEGANVTLSNVVGNKVYSTSTTAGSSNISVNTSELPSGMYILNVATENGSVARKVNIK